MNVTLIGGSGFVGTRLIELLSSSPGDYSCRNIDLLPSHFFNDLTVTGDVCDAERLPGLIEGSDVVVLLAAKHHDDVFPRSLYYDTNVGGMRNTLRAMEKAGCRRLVFFSSVSVYGINRPNPDETFPPDPINDYGRSKWEAEKVIEEWMESHPDWNIDIIRPTVIFGERNRGNVYNLLHSIQAGKFMMVGPGRNKKSMAYVGNVVAFVKYMIDNVTEGLNVFNYIDKPDTDMISLVEHVQNVLGKRIPAVRVPYWLGMMGGYCFDALAFLTRKKLSISSVRVKKFCATTQFDTSKAMATGFVAPFSLKDGLSRTLEFEFVHPRPDDITYKSE